MYLPAAVKNAKLYLATSAILLAPLAAPAATIVPTFSAQPLTVPEDVGTASLVVRKSAKAKSYSRVRVQTVQTTCAGLAPLDVTLHYANSVLTQTAAVPVINNPAFTGDCEIQLKLSAVRYAVISTQFVRITVRDLQTAPVPVPPPVQCPDGTTVPAGQTCPVAPPPPSPGAIANRGEIVTALKPCVGSYIPDALVVGQRYVVLGNNAGVRPEPGRDPIVASGYQLNPEQDDGIHRGEGYFALWVPYDCVVKS